MKDIKEFFEGLLGIAFWVAFIWHGVVLFSSDKEISGLFLEKPKPGYIWESEKTASSRFFWENTKVIWQSGVSHPKYNVYSANEKACWIALPGYVFVDSKKNLETVWQAGQEHPVYGAISAQEETYWKALPGYVFIDPSKGIETQWTQGLKHPDYQIKSSFREREWQALPGYVFVDPTISLKTKWREGEKHPDYHAFSSSIEGLWQAQPGYEFINPEAGLATRWRPGQKDFSNHPGYVSGYDEGRWITQEEYDNGPSHDVGWGILSAAVGSLVKWGYGGDNLVTDVANEIAKEKITEGIGKYLKK